MAHGYQTNQANTQKRQRSGLRNLAGKLDVQIVEGNGIDAVPAIREKQRVEAIRIIEADYAPCGNGDGSAADRDAVIKNIPVNKRRSRSSDSVSDIKLDAKYL